MPVQSGAGDHHASSPPMNVQRAPGRPGGSTRRNSDGALDDELARWEMQHSFGAALPSGTGEERTVLNRRLYADSLRRDSVGSPGIPPQFNGSFLNEDDDLYGSSPLLAPSALSRYAASTGVDAEFAAKPTMGRRDSIGALDLAPLAQTRRGSRGSLRSELASWEALRQHGHPYDPNMLGPGAPQATSNQPLHQGGAPMQPRQPSPLAYAGGAAAASGRGYDDEYRAPQLAPRGGLPFAGAAAMPPSTFADDWQPADMPPGMARGLPKSVSVPSSLTDVQDNGMAPQMSSASSRVWDERGYVVRPPPGFVCRYCKSPNCFRGDRCKYNYASSASTGPNLYGGHQAPPGMRSAPSTEDVVGRGGMPGEKGAGRPSHHKTPSGGKSSHKRNPSEGTRFPPLEQLKGQIYSLCKDQHGCRHLQKKLEEGEPGHVDLIFSEIYDHILELMSDPFGNYLCQKLFAHCSDEQKATIARKAAPGLVAVSLNMHGTRSVQKLIDCLNTDEQVLIVIEALRDSVVPLIKDLNGNHVIQKCLNRLRADQNQFIYDAVTQNCVAVASHRHGCCVLQRCIDHANEAQKIQLATEITFNALTLVQDAFGNYVVQYILDLKNPRFSDALIRRFLGHVYELSLQKFSSNVIEKCIRVAEPDTRRGLIAGLLDKERLPHLLQDSFANYVVQTSLDVADPEQHAMLADMIRPILPAIRHLPYCKRIQSKLTRDYGHGTAPLPSSANVGVGGGAGGGNGAGAANGASTNGGMAMPMVMSAMPMHGHHMAGAPPAMQPPPMVHAAYPYMGGRPMTQPPMQAQHYATAYGHPGPSQMRGGPHHHMQPPPPLMPHHHQHHQPPPLHHQQQQQQHAMYASMMGMPPTGAPISD